MEKATFGQLARRAIHDSWPRATARIWVFTSPLFIALVAHHGRHASLEPQIWGLCRPATPSSGPVAGLARHQVWLFWWQTLRMTHRVACVLALCPLPIGPSRADAAMPRHQFLSVSSILTEERRRAWRIVELLRQPQQLTLLHEYLVQHVASFFFSR